MQTIQTSPDDSSQTLSVPIPPNLPAEQVRAYITNIKQQLQYLRTPAELILVTDPGGAASVYSNVAAPTRLQKGGADGETFPYSTFKQWMNGLFGFRETESAALPTPATESSFALPSVTNVGTQLSQTAASVGSSISNALPTLPMSFSREQPVENWGTSKPTFPQTAPHSEELEDATDEMEIEDLDASEPTFPQTAPRTEDWGDAEPTFPQTAPPASAAHSSPTSETPESQRPTIRELRVQILGTIQPIAESMYTRLERQFMEGAASKPYEIVGAPRKPLAASGQDLEWRATDGRPTLLDADSRTAERLFVPSVAESSTRLMDEIKNLRPKIDGTKLAYMYDRAEKAKVVVLI